jgi:U3 small nucleolar RNA-associated protein 3
MAKKRKAGVKPSGTGPSQDIDPTASKLNVRSWEDVADSEDEFHIHRDKILLDEEPSRKRQRLQAEQSW